MLKEYPDSVHAAAAGVRSDDNCYLGCQRLHESGPSARRIDVSVMGDGFTIDPRDQQLEKKWADLKKLVDDDKKADAQKVYDELMQSMRRRR